MRHRNGIKKLGRTGSHRRALLRNLATALIIHERIRTTHAKAVALRPWAERLITLARRQDLHSRRLAARDIHDHAALRKLFNDIGPRCMQRPGGYLRILKLGPRRGDLSPTSFIELVDRDPSGPAGKTTAPPAEAAAAPPSAQAAP